MTTPVSVTLSSGVAVSAKSTSKIPGDHVRVFNLAADGGTKIWPPTVERTTLA